MAPKPRGEYVLYLRLTLLSALLLRKISPQLNVPLYTRPVRTVVWEPLLVSYQLLLARRATQLATVKLTNYLSSYMSKGRVIFYLPQLLNCDLKELRCLKTTNERFDKELLSCLLESDFVTVLVSPNLSGLRLDSCRVQSRPLCEVVKNILLMVWVPIVLAS